MWFSSSVQIHSPSSSKTTPHQSEQGDQTPSVMTDRGKHQHLPQSKNKVSPPSVLYASYCSFNPTESTCTYVELRVWATVCRPGYPSRQCSFSSAGQTALWCRRGQARHFLQGPAGLVGGLLPTRLRHPKPLHCASPAHPWLHVHFIQVCAHAGHTPPKPGLLAEDLLLIWSPEHLNCLTNSNSSLQFVTGLNSWNTWFSERLLI